MEEATDVPTAVESFCEDNDIELSAMPSEDIAWFFVSDVPFGDSKIRLVVSGFDTGDHIEPFFEEQVVPDDYEPSAGVIDADSFERHDSGDLSFRFEQRDATTKHVTLEAAFDDGISRYELGY